VRPEFVTYHTGGTGLPVHLRRVEDVGRHKVLRADFFGNELNALAPEGAEVSAESGRLSFDPQGINVYVDDWRLAPRDAAPGPSGRAA
jgi:glycerol transport system ATP-binding protein